MKIVGRSGYSKTIEILGYSKTIEEIGIL